MFPIDIALVALSRRRQKRAHWIEPPAGHQVSPRRDLARRRGIHWLQAEIRDDKERLGWK